jgi:tripartite-type tricarboxylate transporter receptor subunit TctC
MALGALSLAAAGLCASAVQAQDARAFFKGKTVTFLVPFGAGGGYDLYARMLAPHYGKHTGATFVVKNQPGGGGLTAIGTTYVAKPDGTTMVIVQGTGAALAQLLGKEGVRFDLSKMGYLGTVAYSPWVVLASPKSNIGSFDDLVKAGRSKLSWAASGPSDGQANGAKLVCEVLKLDQCKIVVGYKGSKGAALSVTRGETDVMYVTDESGQSYVQSGDLKPILVFARNKSMVLPDLPTVFSLAKFSAEDEWLIDYHGKLEDLGRILVTSPGLPADRLKFLQDVTRAILTDEALIAEAKSKRREISYLDPEKTKANVMATIVDLTPEQKARVVKLLDVKG